MKYYADDLKNWPDVELHGGWTKSKPLPDDFITRCKKAIDVLFGRAEALYFRGQ